MTVFSWDEIRRGADGKIVLLYRHERVLLEPFFTNVRDVLDVGGWGILAQRFLEEERRCTILDLFTEDQYYPDRVRALPHKVGDVCDATSFLPTSFDLVTCFETLEHVADIPVALCNIWKWLRSGGHIVGTIPIPGFCHHEGDHGIQFLTEDALNGLLRKTGFVDIRVEPTASVALGDVPCCLYFVGSKR